jgi:hypothetical protein
MPVDHKTPVQDVDGTPVKRVILSIIADYDLKTGLCELVDNAIDQWSDRKYSGALTTALDLDVARQVISVRDNAGGVSKDDLHLLISPGRSRNDEAAELIGIFGVGGKRAVIALAEQTEIKTRFRDQQTHELDITPTWIKSDDWRLPAYAIPDIEPNTTIVSLSYLRSQITDQDLDNLRVHLGQTYAWFLNKGCVITLNGDSVAPMTFETWAYLADFKPRKATFSVDVKGVGKFSCEVTSGLIRDRVQEENNYGPVLSKITAEIGASDSEVMDLVGSNKQGFVAQIRSRMEKPTRGFVFSLVKVTSDGSSWARIRPTTNDPHNPACCSAPDEQL